MSSTPSLTRLARGERLSDQVAAQIQALVLRQEIRPGEKLPPERELCEKLGVSRTVVREAVRSLVARGLLEVRRGDGTVVRSPDAALVSEMMTMMLRAGGQDISFSHLQEVRSLLEVAIAGLAAERRTPDDLRQIADQLRAMREREQDPQAWAAADVAFHAAIAGATHNPLYPLLLGSIADMLMEVRLTGVRLPETPRRALRYHEEILDRIAAGDAAGARDRMQAHLRESEETYRRARSAGSA